MKRVPVIEVKRCFVISDLAKIPRGKKATPEAFKRHFVSAKRRGLRMSKKQLDTYLRKSWTKRPLAYDAADWYIDEIRSRDLGVWRRAGGLPLEWTNRSLVETAHHVANAFDSHSPRLRRRAARAIPGILSTNIHVIQKERYLLPIAFAEGTGTQPRKRLKYRTKYEIDDGCMRSIALTMSGARAIRVYIGLPKA